MSKVHLEYANLGRKTTNRMQSNINKGKYLAVDCYPNHNMSSFSSYTIVITYPSYYSAMRAARRFAKNKDILSVEIDSGIIKLK